MLTGNKDKVENAKIAFAFLVGRGGGGELIWYWATVSKNVCRLTNVYKKIKL